jgi:hypothetical protein
MPSRRMNPRTVSAGCPVSSSMWFSPAPQDQYRSLTRGVLSGTGSGNRSQIGPPAGTGAMSCARRTEVMRSSSYSAPTSSISSGPDSWTAPPVRTGIPSACALRNTVCRDTPVSLPTSSAVMPCFSYRSRNVPAGTIRRSSRFQPPRLRARMPYRRSRSRTVRSGIRVITAICPELNLATSYSSAMNCGRPGGSAVRRTGRKRPAPRGRNGTPARRSIRVTRWRSRPVSSPIP